MASFNRVKPNTYTPRADVSCKAYRKAVEAKYNELVAGAPLPYMLASFESVLDKLLENQCNFVGESVLLNRTQLAQKLGVSKQTIYRLFRVDGAPQGVPTHYNNELKYCTDDVFHFIRKVYPRRTPIYKAALFLQFEAALDKGGVSNIQALTDWVYGHYCLILARGGRHA